MINYIVTATVSASVHDAWLTYRTDHHVAEVVATGCFTSCEILRVTEPAHDGATVYMMRYAAESAADLVRYRASFATALQADHNARFGADVTATRMVADVVARR